MAQRSTRARGIAVNQRNFQDTGQSNHSSHGIPQYNGNQMQGLMGLKTNQDNMLRVQSKQRLNKQQNQLGQIQPNSQASTGLQQQSQMSYSQSNRTFNNRNGPPEMHNSHNNQNFDNNMQRNGQQQEGGRFSKWNKNGQQQNPQHHNQFGSDQQRDNRHNMVQDSYINENFDDSYDQYINYKEKPKGDSFLNQLMNVNIGKGKFKGKNTQSQNRLGFSVSNNANQSREMEFSPSESQVQYNKSQKETHYSQTPYKNIQNNAMIQQNNYQKPYQHIEPIQNISKQNSVETHNHNQYNVHGKRQFHYQSFQSQERDKGAKRGAGAGAGGMKNYLKHTNNQNAIPSPRSDFSGGAMSNFSSTSELKCQVNQSIKMKTPNQTCGPPNLQYDRSSITDSIQKYDFTNTQQSVMLSPSMNYKTQGGKTPQNRQPSQITQHSGGHTPGTHQNQQYSRYGKLSSQVNSMTTPLRHNNQQANQNQIYMQGQSQSNQSSQQYQAPHQMNSSNIHNTSKNDSINQSSKIYNELRGSIREDEQPRGSWKLGDKKQYGQFSNTVYNGKGRKTEDFAESRVQGIKTSGIVSTPQIQQTQKMSRNGMKQQKSKEMHLKGKPREMVILDSDNDIDGAKMDDTDEYVQRNLKSKRKNNNASEGQKMRLDIRSAGANNNSIRAMVSEADEDECEVADEDIGINSLSCDRQTVNSQGVLSMKDFQSLSKRNIFQRQINKSLQTMRNNPRITDTNINRNSMNKQGNGSSYEDNGSPFKSNLLKEPKGPVIGRPMNYAEQRFNMQKQQKQSLFNNNKDLCMNKFDPSTHFDSSSRDANSKQQEINFKSLISNSPQKTSKNNMNPYDQGPFSKTMGDKPNGGRGHLMNLIQDNQRSRQSLSNFNSHQSQKSRNSNSHAAIDERVTNQNNQNKSAQKAKPGFSSNNRGPGGVNHLQLDQDALSNPRLSDQSHREQILSHANRHNAKSNQRSPIPDNVSNQAPSQMVHSPTQNVQSPTQNSTSGPRNIQGNQPGIPGGTMCGKKTKAGVVSPRGIITQMQCVCEHVERHNIMTRVSSRQGNHRRQPSKPKGAPGGDLNHQPLMTTQTDEDYNVSLTQSVSELDKLDSNRNQKICGKYCKNLSSEQERMIILQCLKESIAKHFESLQGKAYEEFKSSMVSESETAKYTAQHFQSMNMIDAQENDKRYLIAASWWREWCDYTNFDLLQLQLKSQSQVMFGSLKREKSGVNGTSTVHINNSPRSSNINASNKMKIENDTLEINYRNQNMLIRMEKSNGMHKQDLAQVREFTHESTIQQIQLSTQQDKEYYNTVKNPRNNDRGKNQAVDKLMKVSPQMSVQSSYQLRQVPVPNKNSKNKNPQLVVVDTSIERSKLGASSKMPREVSFRKASSIVESESQYSVKDSVRQRQADFNKELKLLKLNRNQMQQQNGKDNPEAEYDLANEQDSIAINTDSLQSDRRHREFKNNKFFDVDKDMNSQSSATFLQKQTSGGYNKPLIIQNIELLKDPAVAKEIQQQNELNGNMSPTSVSGGRKPIGGTGGSQQSMNHLYMALKDDLIEHHDYEAVNLQVFQFLKAWYGLDIQIMRFIKRDNVNRSELFLDLYPEKRLANNHYHQHSSGSKQRQQNRNNMKAHATLNHNADKGNNEMMQLKVPEQAQQSQGPPQRMSMHRFFKNNR